jgi:dTDP-4-amino-4,6-dideoxygalactose transaminase
MDEQEKPIHFNWPYMTGKELYYIAEAHFHGKLAGDGPFTKKCHTWLEHNAGCYKALLTHSCTAALEMAALLLNIQPGDEVIMPSYTFVSTANAFVLRGARIVFVDVSQDTFNIDPSLIEAAITSHTKAIVPVHYAGVSCAMDEIMAIARKHGLAVVEDAAQGVMSTYKSKPLGSIGDLGYSFHETKNVISGEGGSLLVNNPALSVRAEIIREKGTDRSRFFRGEVDKYTWQEVGSSFLPGEIIAAFLWAQLEEAVSITADRLQHWHYYNESLAGLEKKGLLKRPHIPAECQHNAHMYYVVLSDGVDREVVLQEFRKQNIGAVFHYVPLHSSPAGSRHGRVQGDMTNTLLAADKLVRLPLWKDIAVAQQDRVIQVLHDVLK